MFEGKMMGRYVGTFVILHADLLLMLDGWWETVAQAMTAWMIKSDIT